MVNRKLTLSVEGRNVVITNPDKVFFARTGHTKLDLVNYYLAVADGAIRGVYGRPMAMKRFVNGADSAPFFQKRAPDNRPDWIETVELSYPSGRTADEIVIRDDCPTWDCGYPFSIELAPGKIFSVYYHVDDKGTRHIAGTHWSVK